MTVKEFKDTVRNLRYWQKKNKDCPSAIGTVRQIQLERIIDEYLDSDLC